MKLYLASLCSTLLQSLISVVCAVSLYLFLTIPAHAIHDTNQNGVSDLWERQNNNGNLIVDFDPTADPDGDGWTNEQEAVTGTNPFDGNAPVGFLRPEIEHIPAVYITPEVEGGEPEILSPETTTITWPTLAGKLYTLFASTDLSPESWTHLGDPRVGNGAEMGNGIPLTQSGGGIPDKLFLRVSVLDIDQDSDTLTNAEEAELGSSPYSADGDSDGLSDLVELFTYQTNSVSSDSDGDGVSDPDEILINFTNPRSATDADGDGIPDDFEKHFAKQLLAYQPAATHWEVYHAGLLAGNLDATHDYTNDGMSVRELAEILKKIPAAGPADSGYLVEQQGRRNSLQWAYYYPPSSSNSSEGTYLHSVPYDYDVLESMTPTADLSSQYLLSRIDGVAWYPSWITSGDRMDFINGMVESAFRRTPTPELSSNGTKFQGIISQQRCRLIATHPGHEAYSRTYLKVIENSHYFICDYSGVITVEPFTVQFPKGRMLSDWYEFKAPIVDESDGRSAELHLREMEVAPEVLAVNSDFDEGRIDPATGYAIPDCDDMPGVDQKTGSGNTQVALNASRAHLDGLFANDEKVTDDMHKGWFGVNPNQLDDDFWDGANVTIRKIDKIDDETGYKESGQVRFYAKWSGGYYGIAPYDFQTLQPVNLVSAGVNLRPSEGVYGASSTIPDGAEFYMEGVRPGKITLEWRLQKGTIDVKHEQTFKVETRKTRDEWREEVVYQIRLQTKVKSGTEVDLRTYNPSLGFYGDLGDQTPKVRAIYYYYRQLFQQMPEKFMWAGMAKVAAAPIYAGMSDLTEWYHASELTPGTGFGTRDPGTRSFINNLLLSGQKRIFEDMAWTHRAYQASGIEAIKQAVILENPRITDLEAWQAIDKGIQENLQSDINEGNKNLLIREQQVVVQNNYGAISTVSLRQPPALLTWWVNGVTVGVNSAGLANAGEWLSANANKNPLNPQLPYGPKFRTTVPGGRLDVYEDRWAWTSNPTSGMLDIWMGASTAGPNFDAAKRMSNNNLSMKQAASTYSNSNTSMLPND